MTAYRYEALDGWRGIAALLVAVMHLPTTAHIHGLALIRTGHLWVDFFFVLSGFVLTHAYRGRLETPAYVATFVWRRFARLWPLHMAVLLAFVALELSGTLVTLLTGVAQSARAFDPGGTNSWGAFLANTILIHGIALPKLTWNHPSWSISVEFWTAIIAASIILLARRRAGAVLSVLGVLALTVLAISAVQDPAQLWMNRTYDLGIFRCLVGFVAGYLAYEVHLERSWSFNGSWSEAAAALGIFGYLTFAGSTALELVAPLFFAIVVLCFADGRGRLSQALSTRPVQALGRWSYAIYIVHGLIVTVLHRALTVIGNLAGQSFKSTQVVHGERLITFQVGSPWVMDSLVLIYVALVLVASGLAWRYIDKPSQFYLNRLRALNQPASVPK